MSEMKATPGPWEYRLECSRWILMASGQPLQLAGRTHRAMANRALSESAPDLLVALTALVELHSAVPDDQLQRIAVDELLPTDGRAGLSPYEAKLLIAARAALAKATVRP